VAAALDTEPDRLRELRRVSQEPASLDVPLADDSDRMRADLVADDRAHDAVESAAEDEELSIQVAELLQVLPARERDVLRLRYGVGLPDRLSLSQIGSRLGVTSERARQIEGQALRRLRGAAFC
jgi:RNA polymerase primary sigma factor